MVNHLAPDKFKFSMLFFVQVSVSKKSRETTLNSFHYAVTMQQSSLFTLAE